MVHRLVALMGVVLIVALVLCLLEVTHDAGGDLCRASVLVSAGVAVGSMLTFTGRVLPEAVAPYRYCFFDPLAPPPRA